jgi:hypothetical protein
MLMLALAGIAALYLHLESKGTHERPRSDLREYPATNDHFDDAVFRNALRAATAADREKLAGGSSVRCEGDTVDSRMCR